MAKPEVQVRRPFFVPEVIQTSALDCGPAVLRSILLGHGIQASYSRLRDACRTEVDGTSLDAVCEVAEALGLRLEERLLHDHDLALDSAAALPALTVTQLPNGGLHFVVLWRRFAGWVQVMDPATGRRWVRETELARELYRHHDHVPAEEWREWARGPVFVGLFRQRLTRLGIDPEGWEPFRSALGASDWRPIARLDSVVRIVGHIVRDGGLRPGSEARTAAEAYLALEGDVADVVHGAQRARPAPPEDGVEMVAVAGVLLVCIHGRREGAELVAARPAAAMPDPDALRARDPDAPDHEADEPEAGLSPDLEAALRDPEPAPARHLLGLLRPDGWLRPSAVASAVLVGALGVLVQAVLFRALLDVGRELDVSYQRVGAGALCLALLVGLLLVELTQHLGARWMGRRLEIRLRAELLAKLPRIGDRYFHSRLTSDMAERCHTIHAVRDLPALAVAGLSCLAGLVATAAGLVWLEPSSAPLAILAAILAVAIPLSLNAALTERELRARTHAGGLIRFYLDSMLGLMPALTHASERSIRREHEHLLVEWARAARALLRTVVTADGLSALAGTGIVIALVLGHLARPLRDPGATLLLVFWALSLPALGQTIAAIARQYPAQRNRVLRLLEPLGSLEEAEDPHDAREASVSGFVRSGAEIQLEGVDVVADGHRLLEDIHLELAPGEHVAVVGESGAGKSTLLHVLLGLVRPSAGEARVDGAPLAGTRVRALRATTAWIDPGIQLWNRTLYDNVLFGAAAGADAHLSEVLRDADLRDVLIDLPHGMQTWLGEGGGLLSGGEGQRVRIARGLGRDPVRLVLLDEAFRGLDHAHRSTMRRRARDRWRKSTLLCVTHDIEDALDFDRVVVLAEGRIVEDGDPVDLEADPDSAYGSMLRSHRRIQARVWGDDSWRRMQVDGGEVVSGDRSAG